jgi:hypothetical protein
MKSPVANEPVLLATVVSILTWLAGRYGIMLDPGQASAAAGAVLLIGGLFARQLVRPVAKDAAPEVPSPTSQETARPDPSQAA